MPKYERYQDYVIRDGKLVGEFEEMYRDYDDPWHQSLETQTTDKAVALHLIRRHGARRIMELGCGLGGFTSMLASTGRDVLGMDISETAVCKACQAHPGCKFVAGDVLDFDVYRSFAPDLIVFPEITWYILNKLDELLGFLKTELPRAMVLHLLTTYPPGTQSYGTDKFTDLQGIMAYFGMDYLEWGHSNARGTDSTRTYFLGCWSGE